VISESAADSQTKSRTETPFVAATPQLSAFMMANKEGIDTTQIMASGEQLSRMFEVDGDATIDSVRREIDGGRQYPGGRVSVQVVPVHTFVLQDISKDVRLSRGILVPSFASHWGVVTGEPGSLTLYHLVFVPDTRPRQKENSDTIRGRRRQITFNCLQWPPNGKEPSGSAARMTKVGVTSYLHEDRLRIGIS
jgi:hypothetical protein